jgi:L-alanine-DL-glutamate epimerase-like enolase superfamily enzyme
MAVEGLNAAQEVERIRLIRDAVGPDTTLMVDINQRWSVHEAISIGRRVEELGLAWLEDPTAHNDYQGLATIADALTTPICAGEYLYGIEPHRQTMTQHSVDIVMIDLFRVGGVTQWMKVAGMAEAFNRPVASHLLPEIHVHLVAAVPNGLVVEYMPWTWRLFDNPPMPDNGEMTVPTGAGLGLKFASDLFEKYGVG